MEGMKKVGKVRGKEREEEGGRILPTKINKRLGTPPHRLNTTHTLVGVSFSSSFLEMAGSGKDLSLLRVFTR